MAAIRQAAPIALSAGGALARADDLSGGLGAGTVEINAIRAGTIGLQSLLKNADAETQIANDIIAVLQGGKVDTKRLYDSWRDLNMHRNEVAKLVLEVIDKHQATNAGKTHGIKS